MKEHQFTEKVFDAEIHFQIVDLGRQLFVWIGDQEKRLHNLYATGVLFEVMLFEGK